MVKISTTLIQIDVTVTDKDGKIVTGLKPEDFEVYENNQKQKITNFSFVNADRKAAPAANPASKTDAKIALPPVPTRVLRPEQVRRTYALVVDDLTLSFESTHFVRRALKKFVDEHMQDGDLVAIIRTGAGMGALQQFTSDRRQLYAAIEKVRWNPMGTGQVGTFAPIEATPLEIAKAAGDDSVTEEQLKDEKYAMENFRNLQGNVFVSGTLGAIDYIVRGMQELPGRKSIMLFSDGFKLINKDRSGFSETSPIMESLRRVTEQANRASVVIYTMDARGLQPLGLTAADNTRYMPIETIRQKMDDRRQQLRDTQDGLAYLAEQTGGFALLNNNDLNGGLQKALNEQNGYYLVGYVPDEETFDTKTRRFNKLSIKVKRPGLKVRYRSGFFGVSDEDKTQTVTGGAAGQQTAAQQLAAALTSPFAAPGINLRLNALFGNSPQAGSFVRSFVHVDAKDLSFSSEQDGKRKATFDVLAMGFGENGVVVDQISNNYTMTVSEETYRRIQTDGFVYNFIFPIKKAGAYQLRIALRDSTSGKVGSANQFIEVPDLKKVGLTLSGIVLENITLKQYQESQSVQPTTPNSANLVNTSQNDTSLRRFRRGTVLRYGFEIYNAKVDAATQKPRLMVQTRVFQDGKLMHAGKPAPIDPAGQPDLQKIAWVGALSLGSEIAPGDYILQIIVTDNLAKDKRRLATQFVQFEVVE